MKTDSLGTRRESQGLMPGDTQGDELESAN